MRGTEAWETANSKKREKSNNNKKEKERKLYIFTIANCQILKNQNSNNIREQGVWRWS